jgi:hypothetical protein
MLLSPDKCHCCGLDVAKLLGDVESAGATFEASVELLTLQRRSGGEDCPSDLFLHELGVRRAKCCCRGKDSTQTTHERKMLRFEMIGKC